MRWSTCASGFGPFTTNSGRNEEKNNERKMDIQRTKDCCIRSAGALGVRICGHEFVELADAGAFWFAVDHLLAGAGAAGALQDSIRRISPPRRPGDALAAPHDGTLGTDDARGARKIPPGDARALRRFSAARGGAEGLIGLRVCCSM